MADPASISAFVASWFAPSSLFLFLNLVIGIIALTSRFATPRRPTHQPHQDASPHLVPSSSLLERFRSFHFGHYKYDTTFPETEHLQPQLVRTPSLIERVRSFQFGFHNNNEPTGAETESVRPDDQLECEHLCEPTQSQLARTPSLLERLKSINFCSLYRSDSIEAETEGGVDVPDANPDHDSGNLVRRSKSETHKGSPARLPDKMRKSESEKSASRRWEEEEEEARVERRRPETARAEMRSGEGSETAAFGEDEAVDAKADDFINKFRQQLKLQRLNSILRYRDMLRGN